jgi:hypothetical protein
MQLEQLVDFMSSSVRGNFKNNEYNNNDDEFDDYQSGNFNVSISEKANLETQLLGLSENKKSAF